MYSTIEIEQKLQEACSKNLISIKTENNPFLKCSYKGNEPFISEKWNIKIYSSNKIVSNDIEVLNEILQDKIQLPDLSLKLLQIDDSGWGFPICGVMVGISDGTKILSDMVSVSFFQGEIFERKEYLDEYANKGLSLLNEFSPSPKTHRIEICTGYINTVLKNRIRKLGYDVRVTEVKGFLQDELEKSFKNEVLKLTGLDLTYDPKNMEKKKISKAYKNVLAYGMTQVPYLLKTGWKSIKKEIGE